MVDHVHPGTSPLDPTLSVHLPHTHTRTHTDYTGYQYDCKCNLSSLSWSTRRSNIWHHRICQTIASSLPSPGAVSFDHHTISSAPSLVPVHFLEIKHSLLPDHDFGTVFPHTCPSALFDLGHFLAVTKNLFDY